MKDQGRKIFHESWYRIANEKICLRSSVKIHRQLYQGAEWYVLHDSLSNQFYRISPTAYNFIARLNLHRTVEDVWNQILEQKPEEAPGQGEIIELLSQLYQTNMLHYNMADDGQQLFKRKQDRQQKQIKSLFLNILYLRIPLFDPDPLLKVLLPLIRLCFSKGVFLLWLITLFIGGKFALDHIDQIMDQSQGFLAPSNIFWIYLTTFIIKAIHEFGHSFAVRRYGGEVHAIGVMFMLLAPLPYMDATAAWSFRNRWQRMLVGASGMFFEFFLAAIACIVWANIGGGPIKSIAYNIMVVASVSTILFNLNPLMKFDGYYILTDFLDIPNLYQNATEHLRYIFERWFFGKKDATTPSMNLKESFLYTVYGLSAFVYRIVLFTGIIIAVSRHYLLLSVVMAMTLAFSWLMVPLFKFLKYLVNSPSLFLVRTRATLVSLLLMGGITALTYYVPLPDTFTAPGVLQATLFKEVINGSPGKVHKLVAQPMTWVNQGDTLIILKNPTLEHKIQDILAQLDENKLRYYEAMSQAPENMHPIRRQYEALEHKYKKLLHDQEQLTICARISGLWISPDAHELPEQWIRKGDSLGTIVDTNDFQIIAVVPQSEVTRLYETSWMIPSARFKGSAWDEIPIDQLQTIPMEQTQLPVTALGWKGGGDIQVQEGDQSGRTTTEPFYKIQGHIPKPQPEVKLYHGRTGKIRIRTGSKPLIPQVWRKIRQTLQKYYRL